MRSTGLLASTFLLLLAVSATSISLSVHAVPSGKDFDNVTIIMMENNGLSDIYGPASYLTSIANLYTLAQHYSGIVHPSEGNYVGLIAGSTLGLTSDCGYCPGRTTAPNLIDRFEAAGLTYKLFAEDASGSGTCSFQPPRGGDHYAFISFTQNLVASRCINMLTASSSGDPEVVASLNSVSPPNYLWLTPNDCNNMHDCSVTTGDNYLLNLVPKILASTTFLTKRALLIITFDEGNGNFPNDNLYWVALGPQAKLAYKSATSYSHYSLLHTILDNWGLPQITNNDGSAASMSEFFGTNTLPPPPPPPPPTTSGNFGTCSSLPDGWNCGNGNGLSGSSSGITNGVAYMTQINPGVGGNDAYYYETTQKGTFPWSPCKAPAPGVIPIDTTTVSTTFTPTLLPTMSSGQRYHIYLAFYYWLPDGAVTAGGATHRCLDTQVRTENIGGTFSSIGKTQTYDPGDSFGWDSVTIGRVVQGNTYTLTGDVASQCQGVEAAWGIPTNTSCQLAGLEIGTEGFQFQELDVAFTSVTIEGATLPPPPPPPMSLIGDLNSDCGVGLDDLSILLFNFNHSGLPGSTIGDENGDGLVNLADLSILLFNYGRTC